MVKVIIIGFLVSFFFSCMEQHTKVFLIHNDSEVVYKNYSDAELIPPNLYFPDMFVDIDSFDIQCLNTQKKQVRLEGKELSYILDLYDNVCNEFYQKLMGTSFYNTTSDSSAYRLYVVGFINVRKNIKSILYLLDHNDGEALFVLNIKNKKLCSLVILSSMVSAVEGASASKSFFNDTNFTKVKDVPNYYLYQYSSESLISDMTLNDTDYRTIYYSNFTIDENGYFKVVK